MRPVHQLEVKVGLLVLAGLIASVAMVMTADKLRIERTYRVTAYLRDAGGLRYESPVTLSGIAIGKVKAIEFVIPGESAPGKVRATVAITQGVILPADVEARLATSGVFGDSSLALAAPAKSTASTTLPADGSGVLVVQAGFIDQAVDKAGGILAAVDDLLDAKTRADAKRLISSAADVAQHTASIAAKLDGEQERITAILANLEASTKDLKASAEMLSQHLEPLLTKADVTVGRVDKLVDAGAGALVKVDALVGHVDTLIAANAQPLTDLLTTVAAAARKAETIASALSGGEGVLGQLLVNRDLAQDLHHVAVDVESAARQVAEKPSRLVFDDVPSDQAREQFRRDREKMRRNLAEGLGQPVK